LCIDRRPRHRLSLQLAQDKKSTHWRSPQPGSVHEPREPVMGVYKGTRVRFNPNRPLLPLPARATPALAPSCRWSLLVALAMHVHLAPLLLFLSVLSHTDMGCDPSPTSEYTPASRHRLAHPCAPLASDLLTSCFLVSSSFLCRIGFESKP
jgi:hypothetical protein